MSHFDAIEKPLQVSACCSAFARNCPTAPHGYNIDSISPTGNSQAREGM